MNPTSQRCCASILTTTSSARAANSGRGSKTLPTKLTCWTTCVTSCARHASPIFPFSMCLITAWSRAITRTGNIRLYQLLGSRNQVFAKGSWGGTFHDDFQVQPGDIVATEHWGSSGFPNTDLDHQLKRHGKEKIIVIGLMANTCIEATARIGMELGYHVTLVRDATAARSREALHAAMDINGPSYAHEILTSQELQ